MPKKICTICKTSKQLSEYSYTGKWLRNQCEKCRYIKMYSAVREKMQPGSDYQNKTNAYMRAWSKVNTEKAKKIRDKYQQSESFKLAVKKYQQSEKGKAARVLRKQQNCTRKKTESAI